MKKPLDQATVNEMEERFHVLSKKAQRDGLDAYEVDEHNELADALDYNDRLVAFYARGFTVLLGGKHESMKEAG